jgi:hypothetical protein
MPIFSSADAYQRFARKVKNPRRFIRDAEDQEFFNALLQEAQTDDHGQVIGPCFPLWRAQLGCREEERFDFEDYNLRCFEGEYVSDIQCFEPEVIVAYTVPSPYLRDRMKPVRDRAPEGRANPKGIPFLYLSNNENTAMSEIRPWNGTYISLAQFKPVRDLKIVNCWTDDLKRRKFRLHIGEEIGLSVIYAPEDIDPAVWQDIDRAFSEPVTRSDDLSDYAPTQIIAELFRMHKFDGIAYRSSFGKGHNIALFDLDAVKFVSCALHQVESMGELKFEQVGY